MTSGTRTREQVTSDVINAILTGADDQIRRSEWRTAVMFLNNRNADQAGVIEQWKKIGRDILGHKDKGKTSKQQELL
jgi:hypothetical protein